MLGGLLSFFVKKADMTALNLKELKENNKDIVKEVKKSNKHESEDTSEFFQNAAYTPSGKENIVVGSSEEKSIRTRSTSKAVSEKEKEKESESENISPSKSVKKRKLKKSDAVNRELIKTKRRLSRM